LQEKSLQLLNDYNCEKEVEAYIKILEKYTI